MTHKVGAFRHIPVKKGISDIIGIRNEQGEFLAVEVKKPGGKLTLDQQTFLEEVNLHGGIGIVVESLEELVDKLDLPLKL